MSFLHHEVPSSTSVSIPKHFRVVSLGYKSSFYFHTILCELLQLFVQAKFKSRAIATMVLFFSLTTPIGIGVGMGISNIYNESSPTALIVEGVFNSASAGILIYMALVDLLAADFMNPRMQGNLRIQLGANISLLLGSGCMSLLAKWA